MSSKSLDRKYGYSPRGIPAIEVYILKRTECWSLLPAYTIDGFLPDPLIMKGSVTGDDFLDWLVTSVLPQMNPYPGDKSILVIDNNNTHHIEVSIHSLYA